jgi:hypothetical protein
MDRRAEMHFLLLFSTEKAKNNHAGDCKPRIVMPWEHD